MEPLTLVVVVLAGALVVAAALALSRRGGGGELAGRLDQMAQSQAAAQAHLAERMQAQERALVKALGEQTEGTGRLLGDLKERLVAIDVAQKSMAELSSQVVSLQDIFANKQARGRFGEEVLETLVRDALPRDLYEFQATIGDGLRVDCLVRLPNPPGPIAIDAKFPREDYAALAAAKGEPELIQARRGFDQAIRKHVKDIADKYVVAGETAEWALMFLPSEAIHAELHSNFPGAVEEARRRRVAIVSPNTLMVTLLAVRALLRDVAMREEAHRIQAEVRKLIDNVHRLDERAESLQKHFAQAAEDVRQVRISTDKVVRSGERIEEVRLGDDHATTEKPMQPIAVEEKVDS